MSFVFAGIIPHSPMLLNQSSKAGESELIDAIKDIEGELYVSQPDTIFIISPHAPQTGHSFTINLATEFKGSLKECGHPDIQVRVPCDMELVSKLREMIDRDNPGLVNVITQTQLDYGSTIPLYFLLQHLPKVRVVPLSVSSLDLNAHYEFGRSLKHVAIESNKRIAIFASTSLAHGGKTNFSTAAATYDNKVIESLKNTTFSDILKLNPSIINEAHAEAAQKTLAVLFGGLHDMHTKVKVLAYDHSLDLGLIVVNFSLI